MIRRVMRMFISYPAMVVMLGLYILLLAVATFIENSYGTPMAKHWIYNNWLFYVLQLLMIVNFVGIAVRQHLIGQRKWATWVFHYAFAVILLGAFVTHVFGREGIIHIREGESSSQMLDPTDTRKVLEALPFSVELKDFRLVRYPGSYSPSSFESDVVVRREGHADQHENIYMNNVMHVGAYRLYQSSYDSDEGGTILSVNRDRIGTLITYAGYVLLLGGMLLSLFHRNSRFRTLGRKLGKKSLVIIWLAFCGIGLLVPSDATAYPQKIDTLTMSELEANAQRQMEHIEQEQAGGGGHSHIDEISAETPEYRTVDRIEKKAQAKIYALEAAVSAGTARAFGRLMVQNGQGRVEPVDTYAAKMLRKIYRGDNYQGLDPNQVILGIISQPQIWSGVPIIDVASDALLSKTGVSAEQQEQGYLSFIDVLDDQGNYIFADEVEKTYAKPVRERNKYDKELLKLDEKINILYSLFAGQMLAIFPHDGTLDNNDAWYSPGDDLSDFVGEDSMFVSRIYPWFASESQQALETGDWNQTIEIVDMIATYQDVKSSAYDIDKDRIEVEMLYNRLNIFKWAGFFYMGFGLLMILALIFRLVNPSRGWRVAVGALTGIIVIIFLGQTFGIGLRWYISGRAPVSNAYETLVFVGWMAAVAGLSFGWKSRITMALAAFLSGLLMFVSTLNWMDPEITPLVPVLKSPWLLIHVASITGSYGFFGIGFLLGLISLLIMACKNSRNAARLDTQIREMTIINEMALTVGLVLLTAGTFIGAVWANESWGRYWGWDPKETWTLITMIVYAFVIHARFVPALKRGGAYLFSLMTVVALGAVLMTFFGVNYYLSGMHSYGGDSAPPALNAIWVIYGIAMVIAVLAWQKRKLK